MFVTMKESVLVDALAKIVRVVAKDTMIPILNCIKMVVTYEAVIFTGSDTQTSIEVTIPADKENGVVVEKTGSIVLPLVFNNIVRKLRGDIIIQTNDLIATIKAGESKFEVNGMDAEDYPRSTDDESFKLGFTIKGSELNALFYKTVHCTSAGNTRPVLQGLCVETSDKGVKVTATDSHRLGIATSSVSAEDALRVVVHRDSVVGLSRAIADGETVEILLSERRIIGKTKALTFRSSLLDGNYPDVSGILPKDAKTTLTLNRIELLSALERLAILAGNNVVTFAVKQTEIGHVVDLTSNEMGRGSAKETLFVGECEGDVLTISFSATYLIDALKVIDSKDVVLGFTGELNPITVKPINATDELQLILPVRAA